jgi:predicted Rossmann-fold nucleotide-binding protein
MLSLMREMVMGLHTLSAGDLPPLVAFCGSTRLADDDPLYQAAREAARLLARAGFAILVGGEQGIMQAAMRGAGEGGMLSIGCLLEPEQAEEETRAGENGCDSDSGSGKGKGEDADEAEGTGQSMPEQTPQEQQTPDVSLRFRHDLARQAVLRASAQAFVVFAGGLETLGDLGQTLTARRAGASPGLAIVLYDHASWSGLLQWLWMDEKREAGVQAGAALNGRATVAPPPFFLCDSPAEIVGCILASRLPDRPWPCSRPQTPTDSRGKEKQAGKGAR